MLFLPLEQLTFEQELMESEISPEYLVTQSNALIETRQPLSLQEKRIIMILASLVQPDDEDFKTHRVRVQDLATLLGIQEKNFYKKVKDIVVELQRKGIKVQNDSSELYINWLSSSEYFQGKGYVELEFSPKLKPYLLQLQKEFTPFKLRNVLRLRSIYSMRMYELLKQYETIKQRHITIAQLRHYLDIDESKLQQYGHFKNKVLKKAQMELAEKTDITFTYDEKKVGRKVVGIQFHIKANEKFLENVVSDSENFTEDAHKLLLRFGIQPEKAEELIKIYGKEHCGKNIEYTLKQKHKVEKISGYIIKAIKENYAADAKPSIPDRKDIVPKDKAIKHVNDQIFFYEQLCKENQMSENQAKVQLVNTLLPYLTERIQERRLRKDLPFYEGEFKSTVAKEIFNEATKIARQKK